jgi:hypothetical protein
MPGNGEGMSVILDLIDGWQPRDAWSPDQAGA